jgi:hypothetical protein
MITNTGKNILAKYLIGQAPAYASHIAIGCGARPVNTDATLGDYSAKKSLDFEMFRVPIVSRGYVNEGGVAKIVLTAELPTEERYEVTEVGVYSAGSNPVAGAYDSKTIYAFTQDENWEHHNISTQTATSIPIVYEPLDGSDSDNVIHQTYSVLQTNADNKIFTNPDRVARYERCRFFNNVVMMAGDSGNLTVQDGHIVVDTDTSDHIHLTGAILDFNKNAPTDELKFAFSVANKDGQSTAIPESIRVLINFSSTDVYGTGEYAKFEAVLNASDYDFENNRYFVITRKLEELIKSNGFTWANVDVVQIFVSVIDNGEPSSDFYVCMDAIRFENTNTANSLYGMTGYSVIKNLNAAPIVKIANTTNYVEFRFAMDVQ